MEREGVEGFGDGVGGGKGMILWGHVRDKGRKEYGWDRKSRRVKRKKEAKGRVKRKAGRGKVGLLEENDE